MPTTPENKFRGWCWTINNPTAEDEHLIDKLQESCAYYIYGRETGEEGTYHLQGYCYFNGRIRFGTVKELLPRAHIEPQRGSCAQAIEYCKKDGQFTEWGIAPDLGGGSTQRAKWARIVQLAESGELNIIRDEFPGEFVRYGGRLRSMRVRSTSPIDGSLANEWWYGDTGSGKSKTLWNRYPNHYGKDINKWWDGYNDEEVVAIEEWSPKYDMLASKLKVWADRYPFNAEIKGGTLLKIRPQKVIVLSNYTIEQCFPNPEDHLPLKRRFKTIFFPFPNPTNADVQFVQDIEDLQETLSFPAFIDSESEAEV